MPGSPCPRRRECFPAVTTRCYPNCVSACRLPPRNLIDYVPNVQAQGLLRGTTGMIGVLAGDVGDPYFSEMTNGIHEVAIQRQLLVATCQTERDIDQELAYFKMLQAHRAGVVILAGSGLDDEDYRRRVTARTRSFRESGGRVVAIGTPIADLSSVIRLVPEVSWP